MVGMEPPSRMKIGRIRGLGVAIAGCSDPRSGFVFCGAGFEGVGSGSRVGVG